MSAEVIAALQAADALAAQRGAAESGLDDLLAALDGRHGGHGPGPARQAPGEARAQPPTPAPAPGPPAHPAGWPAAPALAPGPSDDLEELATLVAPGEPAGEPRPSGGLWRGAQARQLLAVLLRARQANALLFGPADVEAMAVVQALLELLAAGDGPAELAGTCLLHFDSAALLV